MTTLVVTPPGVDTLTVTAWATPGGGWARILPPPRDFTFHTLDRAVTDAVTDAGRYFPPSTANAATAARHAQAWAAAWNVTNVIVVGADTATDQQLGRLPEWAEKRSLNLHLITGPDGHATIAPRIGSHDTEPWSDWAAHHQTGQPARGNGDDYDNEIREREQALEPENVTVPAGDWLLTVTDSAVDGVAGFVDVGCV